jgi:hypothetical protein
MVGSATPCKIVTISYDKYLHVFDVEQALA